MEDALALLEFFPLGIVEQVRDGSTVRVRLLLSDELHQIVTVSLAGVRCPRIGGKEGEQSEPCAEEVGFGHITSRRHSSSLHRRDSLPKAVCSSDSSA